MSYEPVEPFIEHRWEPRAFWLRRPRPVGTRFLIARSDRGLPASSEVRGRIPILLDIGHAFGSGGHGTTEGCLLALEQGVRGGERVLDLGTGSGILAIAARKLGAGHITAVDIRESACRETRENLLLNGIREGVQVLHGGIESVEGRHDIVLANLRTPTLIKLMDSIIHVMTSTGLQIISGIAEKEVHSFRTFLRQHPVSPVETIAIGGWMTLVSRRSKAGEEEPFSRPSGSGPPG